MANSMRLTLQLTAIDSMSKTVSQAARNALVTMNSMQSRMQRVQQRARTQMLDTGFALFGGAQLLRAPLEAAANYEKLRVSMDALTGSTEKGGRLFKQTIDLAASTPLEVQGIAKTTQLLLGFGDTAETVTANVKMLGDITSLTNGDITAAAVAYGQARQEGKLLTRDVRQLINAGVPVVSMFKDVYGEGVNVMDMAQNGEITFERLQKVMIAATSGTGKFANGLAKLRGTLSGTTVALSDEFTRTIAEIGNAAAPALKELFNEMIPVLRGVAAWIKENPKLTKTLVVLAGVFTAAAAVAFVFSTTVWITSMTIQGLTTIMGFASKAAGIMSASFNAVRYALFLVRGVAILASEAFMTTLVPAIVAGTKALWAMAAAILANPIVWIPAIIAAAVAAIVGIVAVTKRAIANWKEWGAAIMATMGPFGLIISTIQSLRAHWESVKAAFRDDGFISGIIRIGQVLMDAVLYPMQQLLGVIGKVTGFEWADNAQKSINNLRARLDLTESANTLNVASKGTATQTQLAQTNQTSNVSNISAPVNNNSSGFSLNYAPNLIVNGSSEDATKGFESALASHKDDIGRMVEDYMRRKQDRRYA